MPVDLSLSVQYGTDAPELSRSRLRRWVQKALDAAAPLFDPPISAATIAFRIVDAEEGRQLNKQFRDRDYATNVLTFEYGVAGDGSVASDIVLCAPVLEHEAAEQHKTVRDHAAHLTVHGVLHSLGYDHLEADEAEEMEALEIRILKSMRIADPYQALP